MKIVCYSKKLLCAATLTLTLCIAPSSFAFNSTFSDLFVTVDYQGGSGKSHAAAQAQQRYGGKVLSVSESSKNGRTVYKVKLLLDSGRIKIVTISG